MRESSRPGHINLCDARGLGNRASRTSAMSSGFRRHGRFHSRWPRSRRASAFGQIFLPRKP